jgi:hypothetical protein
LPREDKEVLSQLVGRAVNYRQLEFFNRLIVSIPKGEEVDYRVMQRRAWKTLKQQLALWRNDD